MTDATVERRDRWIEYVPVGEVTPAPRNPKRHNIDALIASVRAHGYVEPVVRDERTGRLVAGHGRCETLAELEQMGGAPDGWPAGASWPPDGVQVGPDGRWRVPVVRGWRSTSDQQAEAYIVASNRTTELGGWDDAELAAVLRDLDADMLPAAGWAADDLDDLLVRVDAYERARPQPGQDETVPVVPVNPVTRPGDVWHLGPHRIICGDCRDAETMGRFLDGVTAALAVTSPPYADRRRYDEGSGFHPIPPDDYVEWFDAVQANVRAHLALDGSWLVNIKPGADDLDTDLYVHDLVAAHVRRWGWHFATEFCWERNGVPKSPVLRLKNQFEPVYQFTQSRWKFRPENITHPSDNAILSLGPGSGNTSWADRQGHRGVIPDERRASLKARSNGTITRHQGQGGDVFTGQRPPKARNHPQGSKSNADSQGINWEPGEAIGSGIAYPGNRLPTFVSTHEATGHTAAYPVGLPEWFVRLFTDPGDVVLDPFVGSGSTILAAHNAGRVCYGVELSPGYVDVTCARWQRWTGVAPVLDRTGEAYDFTPEVSA